MPRRCNDPTELTTEEPAELDAMRQQAVEEYAKLHKQLLGKSVPVGQQPRFRELFKSWLVGELKRALPWFEDTPRCWARLEGLAAIKFEKSVEWLFGDCTPEQAIGYVEALAQADRTATGPRETITLVDYAKYRGVDRKTIKGEVNEGALPKTHLPPGRERGERFYLDQLPEPMGDLRRFLTSKGN